MSPMPSKGTQQATAPTFLFTADNTDSCSTPSTPPSSDAQKSQCSSLSEVESFECYGDNDNRINDGNNNHHNKSMGVELDLVPHTTSTPNEINDRNSISRNTWARTSLRNPTRSGRRQITSNALASHLYRSSSFNSSGRSSNCDTTEDMYSDISLEDVQDLNQKFELLQRQVTDLADSQNVAEDRTSRTKTEYAVLQTRYHMLEEQYRDLEIRAEERLAEEQKRNRELLSRVEREASLQQENCQIKVKTIEIECNALKEEVQRLRVLCDKQANDLHSTEEKLEVSREHILSMQDELNDAKLRDRKYEQDKKSSEELMIELSTELERIRTESGPAMPTTSPETLRLEELHQELDELRQKNRALEEQNEELEATVLSRGVEEGRHLLNGTLNSLAQELEEMTQAQDSVDSATLASLSQLQQAFQEKDEENNRLKHYIDTILLNIVENYPQLLEVKPTEAKSSS
ncbi:RAB11FIP4.2 family protein [Megaselia abdita]